jgi:hypothetical protein
MASISERILDPLASTDGRTDREIADALLGPAANQQTINAACRRLEQKGLLVRRIRGDGHKGNFLLRTLQRPRGGRDVIEPLTSINQANHIPAAGDSTEQRLAEDELIRELGKKLGVLLMKKTLALPNGGRLELDGASESAPIVCEAWAHVGPAKAAQRHKVMTDAFKLTFAAQFLPQGTRKILVTADVEVVQHLRGKGWMAQALKANDVELHCVQLRPETVEALRTAQKRQFR